METVLCAAVGTASHQHVLEACTVYADCTVCSCRHSKSSAWASSMHCVWQIGQYVEKWWSCTEPICTKSTGKISLFLVDSTAYNHDGPHINSYVLALLRTKEHTKFLIHFHKQIHICLCRNKHTYVMCMNNHLLQPSYRKWEMMLMGTALSGPVLTCLRFESG